MDQQLYAITNSGHVGIYSIDAVSGLPSKSHEIFASSVAKIQAVALYNKRMVLGAKEGHIYQFRLKNRSGIEVGIMSGKNI